MVARLNGGEKMSTNTINTRIQLKYDTFAHWQSSTFIPLSGEVCIATIPNGQNNTNVGEPDSTYGLAPYAIGIKVGDGSHNFSQLPWIQAIAGDVYSWAKAASKPTYTASEIANLDTYISGEINDTDTVYRIQAGTGNDAGKYFLQSKAKGADDNTYTTVSTIDLSSIQDALEFDGTYNASTNKVATKSTVTNAISGLTDTLTGSPGAGKTITAFDEIDGKVTATFSNISITRSQITDAGTAAGATIATSAIIDSDTSTDLPTKAQVAAYIANKTAGLSSAMHYRGEVASSPTVTAPTGNFSTGDVVSYDNSEYVYDGTTWRELGAEGSYALNTISITGSNGLTGGGTISSNRTIEHAIPTGAEASTKGTSSSRTYIQTITTDKFGHITGTTTATESVTDTTYTFSEGSTNGEFLVTPSGGSAAGVKVHGLNDAAYKEVSTSIPTSGTADDAKLPTVSAIKGYVETAVSNLDSSVSATAASNNEYSVITGITQTDGKLTGKTEVKLAKIAKTGSVYDITEGSNTTETGSVKYLIFDCGSATVLVD